MGFFDSIKSKLGGNKSADTGGIDKAADVVGDKAGAHADKADQGADKAGAHADKVDQGAEMGKDAVDKLPGS